MFVTRTRVSAKPMTSLSVSNSPQFALILGFNSPSYSRHALPSPANDSNSDSRNMSDSFRIFEGRVNKSLEIRLSLKTSLRRANSQHDRHCRSGCHRGIETTRPRVRRALIIR